MSLVAGVDGGQSSTIAVVVDDAGVVHGRGTGGPSDHVGQAADSPRAALACELAVRRALAAADMAEDTPLAAVVIGLSGYEGQWHGRTPAFAAARVRYVHDAPIALAGAIERRPAGVVIAGTGSAGYGEDTSGRSVRAGGYGYLFGDAGSGFAIARSAIAAAMIAADRDVTTELGAAALAFFDVPDLRAFARAFALQRIERPQVAGFARVVLDAARRGDPEARTIVEQAAAALAGLAQTIAGRLTTIAGGAVPIALVGGLAADPLIAATVRARVGVASLATIVAPAHEPAIGAALMAFDDAKVPRPSIQTIPA